jgi:hypothetical protein
MCSSRSEPTNIRVEETLCHSLHRGRLDLILPSATLFRSVASNPLSCSKVHFARSSRVNQPFFNGFSKEIKTPFRR